MRRLMMAVTAVAGLALAAGCKRENVEQERQDVAEAQQEASQETAETRQDAQQEMAETQRGAQEDIAEAQQDVQEEREDVAQAERSRQEELQEDTAQGGAGTAGAPVQATSVQGRVLSAGGSSLTLVDTTNNQQLKLKTNDQTRIMQNNQQVKLDDIEEGAQVRASYIMEGKDMVARELTVTQPVMKK